MSSTLRAFVLVSWLTTALACGPAETSAAVSRAESSAKLAVESVRASATSSSLAPAARSGAVFPPLTAPDASQRERLKADVARVAVERTPGSKGWSDVRVLLEATLKGSAFALETQTFDKLGKNVIGTHKGVERPSEIVILSAHYDHIPGCKGADDNASGVAVVMEAARQLAQKRFSRTLVLAFWDMEEDGLVGSRAYAARARANGDRIELMISLDGVGFADNRVGSQSLPPAVASLLPEVAKRLAANEGRANFIAALGDTGSSPTLQAFERIGTAIGQPAFGVELSAMTRLMMTDAARSDHASFWLAGYPGILVTDTANFRNPNYHCGRGPDNPSTLDYDFLNRVASVVIRAVEEGLAAR